MRTQLGSRKLWLRIREHLAVTVYNLKVNDGSFASGTNSHNASILSISISSTVIMKIIVGKDVNNFALQLNPNRVRTFFLGISNFWISHLHMSWEMIVFLEGGGKRLTFRPTLGVVFAMCEHVRETFQSKAARLTHRMLRSFTWKNMSWFIDIEVIVEWNYKRKGGRMYRFITKRYFGSFHGNLFDRCEEL